jgi:hypothetical protein
MVLFFVKFKKRKQSILAFIYKFKNINRERHFIRLASYEQIDILSRCSIYFRFFYS